MRYKLNTEEHNKRVEVLTTIQKEVKSVFQLLKGHDLVSTAEGNILVDSEVLIRMMPHHNYYEVETEEFYSYEDFMEYLTETFL